VPRDRSATETARFILITAGFLLFLGLTIAGVWYFWKLFENNSYKLVASFLILIVFSHVVCKYSLWCYTRFSPPK